MRGTFLFASAIRFFRRHEHHKKRYKMDLTLISKTTKVVRVVRDTDYERAGMPNTLNGIPLASTGELATLLGKKYVTLVAWRNRYADFPKPVLVLNANGTKPRPIYNVDEVTAWVNTGRPQTRGMASTLGSRLMKLRESDQTTYEAIIRMLEQAETK